MPKAIIGLLNHNKRFRKNLDQDNVIDDELASI